MKYAAYPDLDTYGRSLFGHEDELLVGEKRLQSMIIPFGSWLSVSRLLENPE